MKLELKFPENELVCNHSNLAGLMRAAAEKSNLEYKLIPKKDSLTGHGYGLNWNNVVLRKDKKFGDKRVAISSMYDGQCENQYGRISIWAPNYSPDWITKEINSSLSSVSEIEDYYVRKFVANFYEVWMGNKK